MVYVQAQAYVLHQPMLLLPNMTHCPFGMGMGMCHISIRRLPSCDKSCYIQGNIQTKQALGALG